MVWLLLAASNLGGTFGNNYTIGDDSDTIENQAILTEEVTFQEDSSGLELAPIGDMVLGISDKTEIVEKVTSRFEQILGSTTFLLVVISAIVVILLVALGVLLALVSIIFKMGFINITLDAARGKAVYYKTLLNHVSLRMALRFLVASFLAGVVTFIGFAFFIIPGIYFALRFSLVPFVIVDKDASVTDALRLSGELTKGVKFKLLGLYISLALLVLLGFLAFGVGAIVATIVGSLATAFTYNKLAGHK